MAKTPIQAPRERTLQPNVSETRKDQKGYQIPEKYNAQMINQEIDRLHARINAITVEATDSGEIVEDLVASGVAIPDAAAAITRLNLFAEILRNAGLLRRTK